MSGWICLHRKLLKWEWYDDINTSRLFLHCLLRANHKSKKWQGTDIPAGSFISGRIVLAKETGLSEQQIRTALSKLKSTNDITIQSTNRNSLITVTNWASYQSKELNQPAKQPSIKPTDNQQITSHQPQTTSKQLNNGNKLNNKPLVGKTPDDNQFDDFWIMYDKNVNKPKCKSKFDRLSQKSVDTIFNTLPKYIDSTPDKQFRKAPLVYLNNDCWNDEIIIPTNNTIKLTPSQSSYSEFPHE